MTQKPKIYKRLNIPFNSLSSVEFEELLYSIYQDEIKNNQFLGQFDNITRMPKTCDSGRDIKLLFRKKNVGLIQCKKVNHNLDISITASEILKFLLYSLVDNTLIDSPENFVYYFAVSTGFSKNAIEFLDSPQRYFEKEDFSNWIKGIILENDLIKNLNVESVKPEIIRLLQKIKIKKIIPLDIENLLQKYPLIKEQFFDIDIVRIQTAENITKKSQINDIQLCLHPSGEYSLETSKADYIPELNKQYQNFELETLILTLNAISKYFEYESFDNYEINKLSVKDKEHIIEMAKKLNNMTIYERKSLSNNEIWFVIAKVTLKMKDYQNAITYFEQSLLLNPKDSKSITYLAETLREDNQIDRSIELLQKEIKKDSKCSIFHTLLGLYYSIKRDYEKSITYFKEALKIQSKSYKIWVYLGDIYYILGQFENALYSYIKASKINNRDYYIWNQLGDVYYWTKKYKIAMEMYEKSYKIDPKNSQLLFNLGKTSYQLKRYEDSKIIFEKLIGISRSDEILVELGSTYTKLKETQKALRIFREAYEMNPNSERNLIKYAQILIDIKQQEEGFKIFDKGIELFPNSEILWTSYGYSQFLEGNFEESIKLFKKVLNLNHKSSFGLSSLSTIYVFLKKYDEAIKTVQKLIEIEPNSSYNWIQYGNILIMNNEIEDGIKNIQNGLSLNPNSAINWYYLGDLYFSLKDFNKALDAYQNSIKILSMNNNKIMNIKKKLIKKNGYKEAAQFYKKELDNEFNINQSIPNPLKNYIIHY